MPCLVFRTKTPRKWMNCTKKGIFASTIIQVHFTNLVIFTLFRAYNAKIWDRTEAYVFAEKTIKWIKMSIYTELFHYCQKVRNPGWDYNIIKFRCFTKIVPK